jgi:hypothetical protein
MKMKINNEQMKSLLIRDKGFLKLLYEGSNPLKNKRVLNSSNDCQIDTLLKYIHFVANGIIKIKKENFDQIKEEGKLKVIKTNIESNTKLKKLLKSERTLKLKFLNKLSKIYSPLLYILFNET